MKLHQTLIYSTDELRSTMNALHERSSEKTLQFLIKHQRRMMITRSVKENGTKSGLVYHIEKMLKPISENVPAATIKKLPNDHNGNTSKSHQMHKIFNKTSFGCNCRNKDNFPFNDECLTPNIIYRADINTDNDHKFYFGSVEKNFKQRQTIWQLKSNTFNYSTKW